MSKLITLVFTVLFGCYGLSANATDCNNAIGHDRPLWGVVGTVSRVERVPMSVSEHKDFGPGIKYNYTVTYNGWDEFHSYVVFKDTSVTIKAGYRFAWIPVAIATGGRVRDNNRFTPTVYDGRCRPMNLDVAWGRGDIFVPQ